MTSHSCVSLILEMSQTQILIHWSCSSHGGNCIPNLILHGEIKKGCHKQGRPKKIFGKELKNDLDKFDPLIFAIRRNMINMQAQIFQKN